MAKAEEKSGGTTEIGPLLEGGSWTGYQKLVLLLTAMAIILDGFDNQALGLSIPSIVKDWNVSRQGFAPIFALGFLGMSLGTAIGGILGDKIGRRLTLIGCVLVFGITTGLTALANDLTFVATCRFIAGFGLGGAMPVATALIAEFSPIRRRSMAVTLAVVCIPLGGVLGGAVAGQVLPVFGWRTLFVIAGLAPIALAVLLAVALPESPRFLVRRGRGDAARKVMARLGHDANATYADTAETGAAKASVGVLFGSAFRRDTLALWFAFFFNLLSVFVVVSWGPALLAGAGFDVRASSNGLMMWNMGGVVGSILGAWGMTHFGSRRSMTAAAAAAVLSCVALAFVPLDPQHMALMLIAMTINGALINAMQSNLYALAAQVYTTEIRATGVGAAAAVGRLGAIGSSFVGAAVVGAGGAAYFGAVAAAMAVPLIGMIVLRRHTPVFRGKA